MTRDSGDIRQLAQVQTWTLLASQIIPPRKHSPCPRARMQDPTGPGPGIRTGSGRTPGRTAAAAHHPRHRTGTPRRFHSQVADQRTDLAARTRTRPANPYPGAARQRTRDRAAPLNVPAAPGMERPSQPTLTSQHHGPDSPPGFGIMPHGPQKDSETIPRASAGNLQIFAILGIPSSANRSNYFPRSSGTSDHSSQASPLSLANPPTNFQAPQRGTRSSPFTPPR